MLDFGIINLSRKEKEGFIYAQRKSRISFHRGKDRGTLQGVSKSDGGFGYGKAERFIRAGVQGFDRSFGASEQAQRYAAGSNLFQRVL